jgi:type II secretory pathway pseudopilin PulG
MKGGEAHNLQVRRLGERGFGLLLVVVVLTILGFLSLTAFGTARREFRSATELGFAAEAFEAAESGLAAAASTAAGFQGAPLLVPQLGPGMLGPRTRFATTIVRLTESVLFLQCTGERVDGAGEVLARRRLALLGKIVPDTGSASARFEQLGARGWVQLYE